MELAWFLLISSKCDSMVTVNPIFLSTLASIWIISRSDPLEKNHMFTWFVIVGLSCRSNLAIYCGSKPQALPNIRLLIHFTLGIECNDSLFVWYIVSFVDQAYQAIFHWNLPWNNLFYKHSKNILSQLNSTWVTKPDLSQFLTQLTQVSWLIPTALVASHPLPPSLRYSKPP